MDDLAHLHGACACERNQYTVVVPGASASQAQVFFDNSAANRRSQASPLTAWLRVPLDWYHSTTYARFPDETHSSIRRTYYTPTTAAAAAAAAAAALPPTRRQFCGYCGTHLSAWNERQLDKSSTSDVVDVTLGSLLSESLDKLEMLNIIPDEDDEDEDDGLVTGGTIDDEDHVPTNESGAGGVDGASSLAPPAAAAAAAAVDMPIRTPNVRPSRAPHRMQHRGLPYFEELVESGRFGRIKRQKGGHTSDDGTTRVQWEVVEIDDGDDGDAGGVAEDASAEDVSGTASKRQKVSR